MDTRRSIKKLICVAVLISAAIAVTVWWAVRYANGSNTQAGQASTSGSGRLYLRLAMTPVVRENLSPRFGPRVFESELPLRINAWLGPNLYPGAVGDSTASGPVDIPACWVWSARPDSRAESPPSPAALIAEAKRLVIPGLEIYNPSDSDLAGLKELPHLRWLSISADGAITKAGLAHVSQVPYLEGLELHIDELTDEAFSALSGMSQLRYLALRDCGGLTSASAETIGNLPGLRRLWIIDSFDATDALLERLGRLEQLEAIQLTSSTGVSTEGLKHISGLERLRALQLYECPLLTDSGLGEIAKLSRLESLCLTGCEEISAAGLRQLTKLPHLRELGLSWDRLDDEHVSALSLLGGLRSLHLAGCPMLSDDGLSDLGSMENLKELSLLDCPAISDAGLKALGRLQKLEELYILMNDQLTDKALRHISRLKSLRLLSLVGTGHISPQAVERLRRDLPDCKVQYVGGSKL